MFLPYSPDMEAQQDPRNPNLLLEVQQIALISTWEERIEREGPWTFHEGFFEGTETSKFEDPLRAKGQLITKTPATTTGSQPCEQKFLDYIIDDFILVSLNAQWELLEIGAAIDRELPPSAIRIADLFRKLMAQCRRLKASPELFPSPGSRKNFFQKVAILSTFMGNLAKIFAEYDKFQRDAYKPIVDMKQPLTIAVNSGEQATPETGSTVRAIPVFLQHKENAKNPWNNWLDNSANPMPGWIAIQQKIPRTGDKLIRQITQLYDTVNNELTQNNQVALEVKVSPY